MMNRKLKISVSNSLKVLKTTNDRWHGFVSDMNQVVKKITVENELIRDLSKDQLLEVGSSAFNRRQNFAQAAQKKMEEQ